MCIHDSSVRGGGEGAAEAANDEQEGGEGEGEEGEEEEEDETIEWYQERLDFLRKESGALRHGTRVILTKPQQRACELNETHSQGLEWFEELLTRGEKQRVERGKMDFATAERSWRTTQDTRAQNAGTSTGRRGGTRTRTF